jgi:hypothetical protein
MRYGKSKQTQEEEMRTFDEQNNQTKKTRIGIYSFLEEEAMKLMDEHVFFLLRLAW